MADMANSSSILGIEGTPHFYLIRTEDGDNEPLEKCQKLIQDYWGSKTALEWMTTERCLALTPADMAKTDVYVFSEFRGEAFESLRNRQTALILGPPVLMRCLKENEMIPSAPPPWIYNTAMSGLVVTLSGLKEADKERLSNLISYMGGLCMSVLPETGTHLVSNTIFSAKYEAAGQMGIPVMTMEWIDEVWRRNMKEYAKATDVQFDVFKLPVFYNLNVACTLLSNDEKANVERLVSGHGGVFHRSFKPNVVNLLVLNENGKTSDKFKAACKHKKVCVLPNWIVDSVTAGYAVPFSSYEVAGEVRVSTPNKEAVQNPEFSVSHIQGSGNTTVNESLVSVRSKNHSIISDFQAQASTPPPASAIATGVLTNDYYKDCMKNLNVTRAKQAGSFLDGCNIYFSGFTTTEMGKLNKIICMSGATRFEEPNESVTHVIVGKREEKELKTLQDMNKEIHFVKFDWLKESMDVGHVANEDDHRYELRAATNKTVLLEQPSPASKRNIAAMNSSFKRPFPKNDQMAELSKKPAASALASSGADQLPNEAPDEDQYEIPRSNLMHRYLQSTASNMDVIESTAAPKKGEKENAAAGRHTVSGRTDASRLLHTTFGSELQADEVEQLDIFGGIRFSIQSLIKDQDLAQLMSDIEYFGGIVVDKSYKGEVDYLVCFETITPTFKPQHKYKVIVSQLWVDDAISLRAVIPVNYYHRCLTPTDNSILRGITCVISVYGGAERVYLMRIAQAMGAATEEKYEKRKFPILLCDKPEGSKYKGALSWGFPVVTKDWLLDAFHKTYLHKLEDYLVGQAKVTHQVHKEINERGIHRGTEPPSADDSCVIQMRAESPLLSQVPPSPQVAVGVGMRGKRKSDETDTFVRNIEKKLRMQDNLCLLPNESPSVPNNRVKALRTESKSSSSPSTPVSQHVREMGVEFGYDTPRRKQLYDVLKETANKTPVTPHTPEVMKMPKTQLHPDPEATPGRQWDVLHKFSRFLSQTDKPGGGGKEQKKKTTVSASAPPTPLSEIKRRYWQQTLGEDFAYNNNSTILNINSQLLNVQAEDPDATTMGAAVAPATPKSAAAQAEHPDQTVPGASDGLEELTAFINKRKSEPKKPVVAVETCPVECPETQDKETEIMVGWAEPNEVMPFRTPPAKASGRTASSSVARRPPPNFITSGLEVDMVTVKMVGELNGEIQEKKGNYEPNCTHVVCLKPSRVEKVLCAVAAGKWVVPLKYIEDSYEAREFLDEEAYEWGNPKCSLGMENFSPVECQLAKAAYLWRLRIHDKTSDKYRAGAFTGFRVLIWSKTTGFRKVIEYGGGTYLEVGPKYRDNAELARTATHCFLEKKLPFPPDNQKFCKENGILTTDIQFLNEYLLNDINASPGTSGSGGSGGNGVRVSAGGSKR